jgi:hypothetical protein
MVTEPKLIQAFIDRLTDNPPNHHGMTYAEGMIAALEWVLGDAEEEEII